MNATLRAPSSPLVRLLLVNANPDDQRLISDLLDSIPATRFLVDRTRTLAEGIERIRDEQHDACLLDLCLPDGDGLDLLASAEGRGLQLPIIVLSTSPSIDQDRRAMSLGAAALLDRTQLDPAMLERVIRYAIHQRKVVSGLARQAFTDEPTGLISRTLYQNRVKRSLAFARRRNRQVATIIIDLAFDPERGGDDRLTDGALAETGRRLVDDLRETDSVARLADRRLALLIEGMRTLDHAATVARRALRILQAPLTVEGQEIIVTPSIGIAVYPYEGGDADMLMRRAEAATRRAISEGGGCCRFASERIDCEARELIVMERAFASAFEHRDLCLRFHPEIHLAMRRPGLAAEISWRHPEQGWLPLDASQADTEDETLIKGVVDWSLAAAAEQLIAWRRDDIELPHLSITIPFQRRPTLSLLERAVTAELITRKIAPDRIGLDLQASLILADAEQAFADLASLHRKGIRLAIDAFGQERIAIQDLPYDLLDGLKLSPCLHREQPGKDRNEMLLGALVGLGHHLRLTVTAKGARDQRQFGLLKRLGCDSVQLSALPAMSASAAGTWLRTLSVDKTRRASRQSALAAEILVPRKSPRGRTETKTPPPLTSE